LTDETAKASAAGAITAAITFLWYTGCRSHYAFRFADDGLPEPLGKGRSECSAFSQQLCELSSQNLELDFVVVPMTGKELWKIFDEECEKEGFTALTFGDGVSGQFRKPYGVPPEDLTFWDRIAARLERNTIEAIVETMKKQQKGLRHA
jgi:hypothetical protein